jgi:enamine deaminase RidA (YjgF/YER057c/UK114 family)
MEVSLTLIRMIRQFSYPAPANLPYHEGLKACLDNYQDFSSGHCILGFILFIDSRSDDDYFRMKHTVEEQLKELNIPVPCNVQAQAVNNLVSLEIWYDDSATSVEYLQVRSVRYTKVHSSLGKSIWGLGLTNPKENKPLTEQISYSFDVACEILEQEGMTMADIVRQWNYVPDILHIQSHGEKVFQNYQVFNEVRQYYYSTVEFQDGYPSATGIGTRNGNYNMDFVAFKSSASTRKFGLSNPKQQDAYRYGQAYLVGDTYTGQIKKTPLFERAKMVKSTDETLVYISGTASIIGQDTIGIGDIHRQTEVTIQNMDELLPVGPEQHVRYTYLRAYIKEVSDFPAVQSICEAHFPNTTVSYLQADICRPDLLVEIEGAAVVS